MGDTATGCQATHDPQATRARQDTSFLCSMLGLTASCLPVVASGCPLDILRSPVVVRRRWTVRFLGGWATMAVSIDLSFRINCCDLNLVPRSAAQNEFAFNAAVDTGSCPLAGSCSNLLLDVANRHSLAPREEARAELRRKLRMSPIWDASSADFAFVKSSREAQPPAERLLDLLGITR
jgi:hypothetical protein